MKRGTIDHPKMDELRLALDLPKWGAPGLLETLWHWAAEYCPEGDIGRYSAQTIARAIGWDEADADRLIEALVDTGWVDALPDEEPTEEPVRTPCARRAHVVRRLVIHDWSTHAEDYVHLRLARSGRVFADGTMPKLTRLNATERRKIKRTYADSKSVRTACAQRAHVKRTACAEMRPALALSSLKRDQSNDLSDHLISGARHSSESSESPDIVGCQSTMIRSLASRMVEATGDASFERPRTLRVIAEIVAGGGGDELDAELDHVAKDQDPALAAARGAMPVQEPARYMQSTLHRLRQGLRGDLQVAANGHGEV